MPQFVRAQVVIPMDTALPEDAVSNTWHFYSATDADPVTTAGSAHTLLTAFYQAIDGAIYPAEIGGTATVKYYDMADAQPRVPIDTDTIALTPSGSNGLPHEVALVLSFSGLILSGDNPRRRRGRLYIGPLSQGVLAGGAGPPRPDAADVTVIVDAAQALKDDGITADCLWSIYSPTDDQTLSLASSFHPVDHGFVDNAYDTQRRRGEAPTARTLFT